MAMMAVTPLASQAGTVTFAEYDGLANNAVIPPPPADPPQGLPDGVTAVWTGLLLHTEAGDTPMSDQIRRRLALYQSGRPYREPQ